MDLIQGISRYIDHKSFLDFIAEKRKLLELFKIIVHEGISDDSEAARRLYGNKFQISSYKQIKIRLGHYLIDHAFRNGFVSKSTDDYTRARHRCLQGIALVNLLIAHNERRLATNLAKSLISTYSKWDFTTELLTLTRELTLYYGAIAFDSRRYKKYADLAEFYARILRCELIAERYYSELRTNFKHSDISKRRKAALLADKYSTELKEYMSSGVKSFNFIFISYLVLSTRCQIKQDYVELMKVCTIAVEELSKLHAHRIVSVFLFDLRKIVCYLLLNNHQHVDRTANRYLPLMTKGSTNWLVLKFYVFISKIHNRDYIEAFAIYTDVVRKNYHSRQQESMKERWLICEAFISFLWHKGLIHVPSPPEIRIGKLINEIPIYNKDKRGLNITILVIQYILMLQQRKYSNIIDRVEALKQYGHRYLRKDDFFRPHCFIRMLLQIPRADFNRIRTERYAEPYVKKLHSVPLKLSEQSIEVEIIPYEDLWEMTLELLD